jgi:hypothetical protein
MCLLHIEWTSAYIKARAWCFKLSSIKSSFWKAGIYLFDPEILLLALTPPPRMPLPNDQNISQISYVSQILRARGSLCTPKAPNLRQISNLI